MRIIAGTAGGRRITAPQGDATRPTSEQIRGAVFNILGAEVQGASVLDLFGGTGALGLEAMSRGAEHCVITDSSRQAFDAIRKNAEAVLGKDFSETCTLLKGDFRQSLKKLAGRKFSLVFLDPPYALENAYRDSLSALTQGDMLEEDCVIVLERDAKRAVPLPEGLESHDLRTYGDTAVEFVRRVKA